MATLYEIDTAIYSCIDQESGEVIDTAQLDSLLMERSKKLEGVALWIKNLESDAKAIKEEKDALDKFFADLSKALLPYSENELIQELKNAIDSKNTEKYEVAYRKAIILQKELHIFFPSPLPLYKESTIKSVKITIFSFSAPEHT